MRVQNIMAPVPAIIVADVPWEIYWLPVGELHQVAEGLYQGHGYKLPRTDLGSNLVLESERQFVMVSIDRLAEALAAALYPGEPEEAHDGS